MEKKKVVIALGGNALGKDVEEQKEAVAKTAKVIVDLAQQGLDIIVTHGNGPQVGMIQNAMDNWVVMHENYKQVPLPTSVAMSQGYIGIDLQNAIKYELYSRNIEGKVSTILSQVEVDKNDPAFEIRQNQSEGSLLRKRRKKMKQMACVVWKMQEEATV